VLTRGRDSFSPLFFPVCSWRPLFFPSRRYRDLSNFPPLPARGPPLPFSSEKNVTFSRVKRVEDPFQPAILGHASPFLGLEKLFSFSLGGNLPPSPRRKGIFSPPVREWKDSASLDRDMEEYSLFFCFLSISPFSYFSFPPCSMWQHTPFPPDVQEPTFKPTRFSPLPGKSFPFFSLSG